MERAQPLVCRTGALELDRTADQLDNVDAREKVMDEGRRNHRASLNAADGARLLQVSAARAGRRGHTPP